MSKVEKGRARSLWSGDPPQNIFENLNSRNAIFPTSDGVDGSSSLNQSPTLEESVNEVLANNVLMDLLCSWLWELSGSRIALAPGPGPQAKQRIVRQFDLPVRHLQRLGPLCKFDFGEAEVVMMICGQPLCVPKQRHPLASVSQHWFMHYSMSLARALIDRPEFNGGWNGLVLKYFPTG